VNKQQAAMSSSVSTTGTSFALSYECEGCTAKFATRKGLAVHEKSCGAWLSRFGESDPWDGQRPGQRSNRRSKLLRANGYACDSESESEGEAERASVVYFQPGDDSSDSDDPSPPMEKVKVDGVQANLISEQHRFVNLFTELRTKFASNPMIAMIKAELSALVTSIKDRAQKAVTDAAQGNQLSSLADVIWPVQAALASVSTSHKETVVREHLIPSVDPVRRVLGTRSMKERLSDGREVTTHHTDVCYDMPFERVLEQVLQNNKPVYDDVMSSSERWTQVPSKDNGGVLRDLSDGLAFQRHPKLNAKSLRATDAGLTLALGFYGDGVTIACPIGPRHSNSMVELYYWFMINIGPDHRLSLHNIQLATIAMTEDVKRYGAQLVISGGDADGSFRRSTSFGASMHRLDAGITLNIPNPLRAVGHLEPMAAVYTRGWCPLVIADDPAAKSMLGLKGSVAAFSFCKSCDACKTGECGDCSDSESDDDDDGRPCVRRAPNSFLPWHTGPDGRLHCLDAHMSTDYTPERMGERQIYKVRSMHQWRSVKQQYDQTKTEKDKAAILRRAGIASFRMGTLFPHWCFWGTPMDIMHVEFEGLLKDELYLVLHEMCKQGWIDERRFNRAKNEHHFSGGVRLCDLKKDHFQGVKGVPKRQYKSFPFSAHDVLVLVADSVELLGQFVQDWSADFWRCWLLHVEYVLLMLSDAFSYEDVRRLDSLIYEHQTLFLSIPSHNQFWVPKHHFVTHVPLDILFWGPPRNFWCMMLESENQVFKQVGKHSNFKSALVLA